MGLLYNYKVRLSNFGMKISAVHNVEAKKWVNGRKGLLKKIKKEQSPNEKKIWVHCASTEEFEQGRPLIDEIKLLHPEKKIVLTFFSPLCYEANHDYKGADYIYYLPSDLRRNSKRFINYCKPETVFIINHDYWYNYFSILKKRKIPIYFVSTTLRKEDILSKKKKSILKQVTHFFVQNEESGHLLEAFALKNYTIVGDTRFDRVARLFDHIKPVPHIEEFLRGQRAIVAGNSSKAEEALLMQYSRINPSYKYIVVPHDVTDENSKRLLYLFGNKAVLYSNFTTTYNPEKNVLIVDSYGQLQALYQYAFIAIIGGGFGSGIHNLLEAASVGMPLIFGPNHSKSKEAAEMIDLHCAFPVNNIEDFNTIMNHLLHDPILVSKISQTASEYVKRNIGATRKILGHVFDS